MHLHIAIATTRNMRLVVCLSWAVRSLIRQQGWLRVASWKCGVVDGEMWSANREREESVESGVGRYIYMSCKRQFRPLKTH
jgi:hypothetical protein